MDVEEPHYLASLVRINEIHGTLCPGLPRPEQH
jgi:hypothetical protein